MTTSIPRAAVHLHSTLPAPPPSAPRPDWPVPDAAACHALLDAFAVPDHIRTHSVMVANVATLLAERAAALGLEVCVATVRAAGLLHDAAKLYTIEHGGNHAQLGAAWALEATGNPLVAHGVLHHMYWPFPMDARRHFLPLAVLYGDKRVAHDRYVPVAERFSDITERYGVSGPVRERIAATRDQAIELERILETLLEIDLNACAFDSGRLVQ